MMKIKCYLALGILLAACNSKETETSKSELDSTDSITVEADTTVSVAETPKEEMVELNLEDTSFVNIKRLSDDFAYDMRYATDNNFLKETVYECTNCLMRYEVAKALIKANDSLQQLGYKIKFYDCFRPVKVQLKMWEIYPDARYVANPYKTGSVHNKGAALDITLVKINGDEVDMGTDFDHFGEEAHHSYENLADEVLENRRRLKGVMTSFGFNAIRTEWWHYNFGKNSSYKISDEPLCDEES